MVVGGRGACAWVGSRIVHWIHVAGDAGVASLSYCVPQSQCQPAPSV